MNITFATADYEGWLAGFFPPWVDDLESKHERMADPADPFPFFRATYYQWVRLCPDLDSWWTDAPVVRSVGDLHVENYGTWRDADGRLCWGVNDFDEADLLPYPRDLVRLAVSVRLARRGGHLRVKSADACRAILAGYRRAMQEGGRPFVLEERHPRLRALAMAADHEPSPFWAKYTEDLGDETEDVPEGVRSALLATMPVPAACVTFRRRTRAGLGSLGRPRFVALAEWGGCLVAREAKAAAPPATAWAVGRPGRENFAAETLRGAVRCPDPLYLPGVEWNVRRVGPRCSRIELERLGKVRDVTRLLKAMGAETANVHLGTPWAADTVLADLSRKPGGWLREASGRLAELVETEWRRWRKDWCL